VSGRTVRVRSEPGPGRTVRIGCGDRVRDLHPGDTADFVAPAVVREERSSAPGVVAES